MQGQKYEGIRQVIGNYFDILNLYRIDKTAVEELDYVSSVTDVESDEGNRVLIRFPEKSYISVEDQLYPVDGISFALEDRKIDGDISADLLGWARDTLIDAISGERRLIPDPGKALAAHQDGYSIDLRYEAAGSADLGALLETEKSSITNGDLGDFSLSFEELDHSIKVRMMLALLQNLAADSTFEEVRARLDQR